MRQFIGHVGKKMLRLLPTVCQRFQINMIEQISVYIMIISTFILFPKQFTKHIISTASKEYNEQSPVPDTVTHYDSLLQVFLDLQSVSRPRLHQACCKVDYSCRDDSQPLSLTTKLWGQPATKPMEKYQEHDKTLLVVVINCSHTFVNKRLSLKGKEKGYLKGKFLRVVNKGFQSEISPT